MNIYTNKSININNKGSYNILINSNLNHNLKNKRRIKGELFKNAKNMINMSNNCSHSFYKIDSNNKAIDRLKKYNPINKSQILIKNEKIKKYKNLVNKSVSEIKDEFINLKVVLNKLNLNEFNEIIEDPLYYLEMFPDILNKIKRNPSILKYKLDNLNRNKKPKKINHKKYNSLSIFNKKPVNINKINEKLEFKKNLKLKFFSKMSKIHLEKRLKIQNKFNLEQKLNLKKNKLILLKKKKIDNITKEFNYQKLLSLKKLQKYKNITNNNINRIKKNQDNFKFFKDINNQIKEKLKEINK